MGFCQKSHGLGIEGWEIEREQALLIDQDGAMVLRRQQELIRLIRENGWIYGQAVTDVKDAPAVSGDVLQVGLEGNE